VHAELVFQSVLLGLIYAIVGLGFIVVYKASGIVNFAQGETVTVGAYVGLVLYILLGLPIWIVLPIGVAACFLVGVIAERVVFRPLLNAPVLSVIIASIGLGIVIKSGIRLIFGPTVYPFPPYFSTDRVDLGVFSIVQQNLWVAALAVLLIVALFLFFGLTKVGLGMQAVMQNRMSALLMGVNLRRTMALTWGLCFALGGAAGMLLAPLIIVGPDMGLIAIKAFVVAIIGGFESLLGVIIGGLLLAFLETFAGYYVSSALKDMIAFFVLILVIIAFPSGLFGGRSSRRV
jgi:branched-chain amino acid transport system permease protein